MLYRLQGAGILQHVLYTAPLRGRPPNRWWVNPRLTTTLSAGNTGNAGKSDFRWQCMHPQRSASAQRGLPKLRELRANPDAGIFTQLPS